MNNIKQLKKKTKKKNENQKQMGKNLKKFLTNPASNHWVALHGFCLSKRI